MGISQEIHLGALSTDSAPFLSFLQTLGRGVLHIPNLGFIHPLAQRVLGVIEPAGRLSIRRHPSAPAPEDCLTITVLSANLNHDWPKHRRLGERLMAFADLVEEEGADVVLVQEVLRTPKLRVDEWLSERLNMAYVYSRANGHEGAIGFEEGLAIFSRFSISQPSLRELGSTTAPFTRRLALGARLETPCGRLMAFSVHLSLFRQRNAQQMKDLHQWVDGLTNGQSAFIAGDFNAPEDTPQIAQAQRNWLDVFRYLNPQDDGATHEVRCPRNGRLLRRARLDYLFLNTAAQRWRVTEARHVDAPGDPHSDHRAVLARLTPHPFT